MNAHEQIQSIISQVERRYDPDHDLPASGSPPVTWAEMMLLDLIKRQQEQIEKLEHALDHLAYLERLQ